VTDALATPLADLERAGSELSEVTRLVTVLERTVDTERTLTLGIAGNVTTDLLEIYLRKQALLHGHRARVLVGGFDDPIGSAKYFVREGAKAVIFLNLADALLPAFEARIPTLAADVIDALLQNLRSQLSLALTETRDVRHVFVSLVHRLVMPAISHADDPVDAVLSRINEVIRLESERAPNVRVIATGDIAAQVGWERAHDWRSYERFRAPFTPAFMDRLALDVYRSTRGFGTYFYKALALDCDNTLWGGILGEDLADGIKLGPHGYPGDVFWRVQHELLALQQKGVLLCLCTKNNAADVDALLASHPEMVLRDEHFAAKAVNWDSKAANLRRLAEQLNIGLDSFVFLDDSPFECEAVRGQLPMVRTIQVPDPLSAYPAVAAELRDLFMVADVTSDSASKTAQYRLLSETNLERARHASEAEFLASLGLTVTVRRNDQASAARVSELTLKSNQFNLTTRRYTVAEISSFMESHDTDVYSIHVADKFGDSGLTGVIIVRYGAAGTAAIDTVLLSCRVLGRGVETSVWMEPLEAARSRGCTALSAEYIPTPKNGQVRDLLDRLGFRLVSEQENGHRTYQTDLAAFSIAAAPYIEVVNVV
jgi:FkbH-like protein